MDPAENISPEVSGSASSSYQPISTRFTPEEFRNCMETLTTVTIKNAEVFQKKWIDSKLVKINLRTELTFTPFQSEEIFLSVEAYLAELLSVLIPHFENDSDDAHGRLLDAFLDEYKLRHITSVLDISTINGVRQVESSNCAICLEPLTSPNVIALNCHETHQFHRNCIHIWFEGWDHCPICRALILHPEPN